jgi:cadherin-like protein/hemolysin type calcium-binding protein
MTIDIAERLDSLASKHGLRLEASREAIRDGAAPSAGLISATAGTTAISAATGPAGGVLVWDQLNFALNNSVNIDINTIANDFQLTASQKLVGFSVILSDNETNNDGLLGSFSGVLGWAIYGVNGAEPGAILATATVTPTLTDTGQQDDFGSDLVRADVIFTAPVALDAGTYWLGIEENGLGSADDGSRVWWQIAPNVGSGVLAHDSGGWFGGGTFGSLDTAFAIVAAAPPQQTANAGLTLNEGATATVSATLLAYVDDLHASGAVTYTLDSLATHGEVELDGEALGSGDTFTQADIGSGKLAYVHDGSETTSDSFGFSVADSDDSVAGQTFAITVSPVNDAPVVSAPASLGGKVDQAITISGLSFADPDAGSGDVTVTLSVSRGTLSAAAGAGVATSGSGTGSLQLTGDIAAINAFIAAAEVSFLTASHDVEDVVLEASIDDGGNAGSGGAKQDAAQVSIAIADDRQGGSGADRMVGSAKDSTLSGSDGDDRLSGAQGDDMLSGDDDDDRLKGSSGDDTLNGGNGDDRLAGQGGDDHLDGGDGIDTVDFSKAARAVTVDLGLYSASGEGTDAITGVERVYGSALGDSLSGDASDNGLFGGAGADTLSGGDGADLLDGGDGDDQVSGGVGLDVLRGGDGADALAGDGGDDVLSGGVGNDTLTGGLGADIMYGGSGDDVFIYTAIEESTYPSPSDPGIALADVIYGFKAGDLIDLSAIDADPSTGGDDAFHLGFGDGVAGAIQIRYDADADQTLIELYLSDDPDSAADGLIVLDGRHNRLTAADFVL